ncbi:hypothetical protein M885DRAFT_530136 [Pelagophyceae sp. CCMP2097]|nr:hypothetical protein M885DRAFT_530136 [Pelagophyceae sp. CCMP2097]
MSPHEDRGCGRRPLSSKLEDERPRREAELLRDCVCGDAVEQRAVERDEARADARPRQRGVIFVGEAADGKAICVKGEGDADAQLRILDALRVARLVGLPQPAEPRQTLRERLSRVLLSRRRKQRRLVGRGRPLHGVRDRRRRTRRRHDRTRRFRERVAAVVVVVLLLVEPALDVGVWRRHESVAIRSHIVCGGRGNRGGGPGRRLPQIDDDGPLLLNRPLDGRWAGHARRPRRLDVARHCRRGFGFVAVGEDPSEDGPELLAHVLPPLVGGFIRHGCDRGRLGRRSSRRRRTGRGSSGGVVEWPFILYGHREWPFVLHGHRLRLGLGRRRSPLILTAVEVRPVAPLMRGSARRRRVAFADLFAELPSLRAERRDRLTHGPRVVGRAHVRVAAARFRGGGGGGEVVEAAPRGVEVALEVGVRRGEAADVALAHNQSALHVAQQLRVVGSAPHGACAPFALGVVVAQSGVERRNAVDEPFLPRGHVLARRRRRLGLVRRQIAGLLETRDLRRELVALSSQKLVCPFEPRVRLVLQHVDPTVPFLLVGRLEPERRLARGAARLARELNLDAALGAHATARHVAKGLDVDAAERLLVEVRAEEVEHHRRLEHEESPLPAARRTLAAEVARLD